VALAEASFGPKGIGADVTLDSDLAAELLLFHEGPSRILVSTQRHEAVYEAAKKNSINAIEIGATLKARMVIRNRTETLINSPIGDLYGLWNAALEHLLHSTVPVE